MSGAVVTTSILHGGTITARPLEFGKAVCLRALGRVQKGLEQSDVLSTRSWRLKISIIDLESSDHPIDWSSITRSMRLSEGFVVRLAPARTEESQRQNNENT